MKLILSALMLCTSVAFATEPPSGRELGTVEAWSNWYKIDEEIQIADVCGGVLAHFQRVNATRPYEGILDQEAPVGYKQGTNFDGQTYFALSCRIRVYRALLQTSRAE